jgi:hypothetical protein
MIPTEAGTYTAEYSNTCSCSYEDYENDTGESAPVEFCFGECWENTVQHFTNITEHLFTENNQQFTITGFPTWRGPVNGMCSARNAEELLWAMTPERAEWRLDVTVHEDRIVANLYHHDCPTGGTMIVAPFTTTEEENY